MSVSGNIVKAILDNGDVFLFARYEGHWGRVDHYFENGGLFGNNIVSFVMEEGKERYVSIEYLEDFEVCNENEYGL